MASSRPRNRLTPQGPFKRADLTDLQLRAIGSVIYEWAVMEQSLYIALAHVFGGVPANSLAIRILSP
jgi:hypothetical protein